MQDRPISSLWFTWYLLSDLDGRLQRLRRAHRVLIATGVGLDAWEREMYGVAESLDEALHYAQAAGIDSPEACPDLLPERALPWPARGLHLWWTTRETLHQTDALLQVLRADVARALKRLGDSDPDASWFEADDGAPSSRRRRGSLNPRSTSSRVIAAG